MISGDASRLVVLADTSPAMLWLADAEGRPTFYNRALLEFTGRTLEEELAHGWQESLHPEDGERCFLAFHDAFRKRRAFRIEYRLRRADGEYRCVLDSGVPLFDAGGALDGYSGSCIDITDLKQAEAAARDAESRFQAFMDHSPAVAFLKDAAGRYVYVNRTWERFFGMSLEDLVGRTDFDWMPDEAARALRENDAAVLAGGVPAELVVRVPAPDGEARDWLVIKFPVPAEGGRILLGGVALDQTARLRAEEALRESTERYARAARGANDGLWDWDLTTGEVYYSPRWKEMVGFAEDEVGRSPEEWVGRVHGEDVVAVRSQLADHLERRTPHFETEHRVRHKDGGWRWMLSRALAVRDEEGRALRITGSQTDITKRKAAEEQLLHDALHDGLTGLPNRTLFMDRLTGAVARSRRRGDAGYAVVFLDLDRFKLVNDGFGHFAGDRLLVTTARRLESCLRACDTVARFGGDEFAVLLDGLAAPDHVGLVVERIQRELSHPVELNGEPFATTVSMGVALGSPDYDRFEDLLRDADAALYRAKAEGKARHRVFEGGMRARVVMPLSLASQLRRGLERREFVLLYEPVVSLPTGDLLGFETCVRWHSLDGRLYMPQDFLPAAEEGGLVIPIERWALGEACRQAAIWPCEGEDFAVRVVVKLSARTLAWPGLLPEVERVLSDSGLDPARLEVEVVERDILERPDGAPDALARLRELGLRIVVGRFGAGASSLALLHRLALDALELAVPGFGDPSGAGREGPRGSGDVLRTVAAIARELDVELRAGGVDSAAALARLNAVGCRFAHGPCVSPPLSATAAEAILEARRAGFPLDFGCGDTFMEEPRLAGKAFPLAD
ncbi:MAG: PAS domain S-box protein [Gemmatimonadetes bacterium]|nr:PAS domain S-box protein [Gemmatimonadota bacterium]